MRAKLDHGPCKSLLVPDSWARDDERREGASWLTTFVPAQDTHNTLLGIFDRGVPVNDSAMANFKRLLREAQNTATPKQLPPAEIESLAPVMGITSVGDNQFTNFNPYPDLKSPVFFLDNASLKKVQGRMVLEIEGKFLNQKGATINFFRGIFIPSETIPDKVQEVFFQAGSEAEFKKSEEIYRNALESITW